MIPNGGINFQLVDKLVQSLRKSLTVGNILLFIHIQHLKSLSVGSGGFSYIEKCY